MRAQAEGRPEQSELRDLAATLVAVLSGKGCRFACAESCTGGLLAAAITAIPGASEVFWGSIVSYTEKAKADVLGVDTDTLARYGAVSCETALEMARGVSALSSADLAVSITGYAGPGGGEIGKPVGTVWIGLCPKNRDPEAQGFLFRGNRAEIRTAAACSAISMVLDRFSD